METINSRKAAEFRVVLLLKKYKFGAVSAAKYLGKPRGLIQSWMQIGNKHHLAKEKIQLNSFEKILKELRKKITNEHLDYFLAKRLFNLDLPVAFIGKVLNLPTSTVRSWKFGKVPIEIKQFFYNRSIVDRKFAKLLRNLKSEVTKCNLEYFLALRLLESSNNGNGRRLIGGRLISQILTNHFGYIDPIPEKTISCWIDKKRKPWNAFEVLMNEHIINKEFNKIIDELTQEHMDYHVAMKLYNDHGWTYNKISSNMGLDKERVRGWVKKARGNPIAKSFSNSSLILPVVVKYLSDNNSTSQDNEIGSYSHTLLAPKAVDRIRSGSNKDLTSREKSCKLNVFEKESMDIETENDPDIEEEQRNEINTELENELIYHLKTMPSGISSAQTIKSILIDQKNASISEIEAVLEKSEHIVKDPATNKWVLKTE
jgi:hypothetical protein